MNERQSIYRILLAVEKGAYVGHVLEQREEEHQNEGFIRRVVYGVLDHQQGIDRIIDQTNQSNRKRLDVAVRIILRMAVYQMAFMDRTPAHAIVDEAVKLAKKHAYRYRGFVNGLLREMLRKESYISLREQPATLPDFLEARLVDSLGQEKTQAFLRSMQEEPHLCVRYNPLKITQAVFEQQAVEEGVKLTPSALMSGVYRVENPQAFFQSALLKQGLATVQDEGAATIVAFGQPEEGQRWLDVCAAPGGKAMQLAECVGESGQVVAADLHPQRVRQMQENIARGQYKNIETEVQDGTELHQAWVGAFDGVLADVPCSGLGLLRRKPDIRYHRTEEEMDGIVPVQQKILETSAQYVKSEGVLLYSTCTLVRDENETQVRRFLESHNDFSLEEEQWIDPVDCCCDGFYMARLRRA